MVRQILQIGLNQSMGYANDHYSQTVINTEWDKTAKEIYSHLLAEVLW